MFNYQYKSIHRSKVLYNWERCLDICWTIFTWRNNVKYLELEGQKTCQVSEYFHSINSSNFSEEDIRE